MSTLYLTPTIWESKPLVAIDNRSLIRAFACRLNILFFACRL